ncbi:MAG: hypothetical protein OIF32_05430 [Campylobacterales bacterium]|nr:hypothetical protein [Campylobacterales bacterium]
MSIGSIRNNPYINTTKNSPIQVSKENVELQETSNKKEYKTTGVSFFKDLPEKMQDTFNNLADDMGLSEKDKFIIGSSLSVTDQIKQYINEDPWRKAQFLKHTGMTESEFGNIYEHTGKYQSPEEVKELIDAHFDTLLDATGENVEKQNSFLKKFAEIIGEQSYKRLDITA